MQSTTFYQARRKKTIATQLNKSLLEINILRYSKANYKIINSLVSVMMELRETDSCI